MEMTTFLLYCAIKLDDLKELLGTQGVGVISGFILLMTTVCIVMLIAGRFFSAEDSKERKACTAILEYKKTIYSTIFIILFSIGGVVMLKTMLPSTKQALALVTVDLTLKNSDKIIQTGGDVLSAVDGKVEKYLRIITGKEAKAVIDNVKDTVKEVKEAVKDISQVDTDALKKEAGEKLKGAAEGISKVAKATGGALKEINNELREAAKTAQLLKDAVDIN
jgi:esterase/lipase